MTIISPTDILLITLITQDRNTPTSDRKHHLSLSSLPATSCSPSPPAHSDTERVSKFDYTQCFNCDELQE